MPNHFHIDLGNLPPIAWIIIPILLAIIVGKIAEISILFNIGAIGLGITVVLLILAFARSFFD